MQSLYWATLITLPVIWNILSLCNAANHYCVNGHPIRLVLDDLYHRDETIVPAIPDEPVHKRFRAKFCHWDIEINADEPNLQLVLEGLPSTDAPGAKGTGAQPNASLVVRFPDQTQLRSSVGMFHVYPLAQRKHFSVEVSWNPKFESGCPVSLRILVPIPGASRDMLSFHGNRYTVSQTVESITAAASNIKGSAQLASFTSLDQVKEFVGANNAKMNDFPYKRPLELSHGVRVGLFYRQADSSVLSLVRSGNSSCRLVPVDNHGFVIKSPSRVACGFLSDNPESSPDTSPRIEFGDCAKPALTLMSFSETAATAANTGGSYHASADSGCNDLLSRLIVQESRQQPKLPFTERPPNRDSLRSPVIPVVICAAVLAAATAVILTAVCLKRRSLCTTCPCSVQSQKGISGQYNVYVLRDDSAQLKCTQPQQQPQHSKCSTYVEFTDTVCVL